MGIGIIGGLAIGFVLAGLTEIRMEVAYQWWFFHLGAILGESFRDESDLGEQKEEARRLHLQGSGIAPATSVTTMRKRGHLS